MESDCYRVQVLHHMNPYLIWVEVIKDHKNAGKTYFEQIGVYGILPLEISLDLNEENLETLEAVEWSSGALKVMTQVLNEAMEVWFSPVHIDRRSSIFQNKIHKYGEIDIITKTAQKLSLSKILIKTKLATFDEAKFYIQLTSLNLQTNLDEDVKQKVINQLEELIISNGTNKGNSDKKTSKLTEENLKRHNSVLPSTPNDTILEKYQKTMPDQYEDLNQSIELESIDSIAIEPVVEQKQKLNTLTALLKKHRQTNKPKDVEKDVQIPVKTDMNKSSDSIGKQSTNKSDSSSQKCKIKYKGIPEKNVLVAFGPPEIDKKLLCVKSVPGEKLGDTERMKTNPIQFKPKLPEENKGKVDKTVDSKSSDDVKRTNLPEIMKKMDLYRKLRAKENSSTECSISVVDDSSNFHDASSEVLFNKTEDFVQESNVNPFKNYDFGITKFIDKLVTPILMVHSKMSNKLKPLTNLRDVNFNTHIQTALRNMSVKQPMMIQSISWFCILRGYSLFMISTMGSGKTVGYAPAVCRLVVDYECDIVDANGPICIIVCGTTKSVIDTEKLCKRFLNKNAVLSCYPGKSELGIATSLFNGCDILITTPPFLVKLLNSEFSVDLRRLTTIVLDDCERLNEVYLTEVKYLLHKMKEILKSRINKELQVQYIVASRVWCDFMEPLAKRAPRTVVSIGSFQECVIYSKANMSVSFVQAKNKKDVVLEFLSKVDKRKPTVIVCRNDEEVEFLNNMLKGHSKFTADSKMTIEELYDLNNNWNNYSEPLLGPILICCDSNLIHLNVTNANNLIHYSLPNLFSMFCKRFAVLTDNYPSIFSDENQIVNIKVLVEDSNVEQLPKILNFVKRCTDNLPESLNSVCEQIMKERDYVKAEKSIPICDNLLGLGVCPDFWYCRERHTVFPDFDNVSGLPKSGMVTFRILHYHSPITYSARLLSSIVNGKTTNYPQNYSTLSLKMGLYFSNESNRRLISAPKIGEFCAVSLREDLFERCQIVNILSKHDNGTANLVLVKMIDEEKYEKVRDIYLYHLPDNLKSINSYVSIVRICNIQPKDRDVTFSNIAKEHMMKYTEDNENWYLRGKVVAGVGNNLIVDDLVACQDLTTSKQTVVRLDFKEELLKEHAIANPDHISNLHKIMSKEYFAQDAESKFQIAAPKELPKPRWAHLNSGMQLVYFATAKNPNTFFVRLEKFDDCLDILTKDIQAHVKINPKPCENVNVNDIVLAKFPDDDIYYRARVDNVEQKVKCFFVDHGDWRVVDKSHILPMIENFIVRMPFQAIECRLVGVKPFSGVWSEYSTNWLCDQCIEGSTNDLKQLYVKYFVKEKAKYTVGHKYGVILVDTTTDDDIVINKSMIELNLAEKVFSEIEYLDDFISERSMTEDKDTSDVESLQGVMTTEDTKNDKDITPVIKDSKKITPVEKSKDKILDMETEKLMKSLEFDVSDGDNDSWDIEFDKSELKAMFKTSTKDSLPDTKNVPQITDKQETSSSQDFEVVQNVQDLDSDDLSSPEKSANTSQIEETVKKPKTLWRQTKTHVYIKIELIGVEKYEMNVKPKDLSFCTILNDVVYAFNIELYGYIDVKLSTHDPKGLYVNVKLAKVIKKNWLFLTKDGSNKNWISYDPFSIDASSDEENCDGRSEIKRMIERCRDNDSSDNDDDQKYDDMTFRHKYIDSD